MTNTGWELRMKEGVGVTGHEQGKPGKKARKVEKQSEVFTSSDDIHSLLNILILSPILID
jgi:hypothetical protein